MPRGTKTDMSVEDAFRALIRNEIESQLAPFREAVEVLRARRGSPPGPASSRGCAIRSCRRPARTKGYCAAHYQKLRMLTRTNRRPSAWVDFAPQGSVDDVVLPRGRAAAKAKRAAAASA